MDERQVEQRVAKLLARTERPMSPNWQGRVLAGVAEARRPCSRRVWRLAGAVAIAVMLLPLGGMVVWELGPGRFHSPAATADRVWEVTATTPEGQQIRSVRFVVRQRGRAWGSEQSSAAWARTPWRESEISIQYPDKMRVDPSDRTQETTLVRNGDRELADLGSGGSMAPYGPSHYKYMLGRPTEPLPSPDLFTERGVVQAGLVSAWGGQHWPYRLGEGGDRFARHWEADPDGAQVLVVEHSKASDPTFHGTYRTRIDPGSHLVLGWQNAAVGRDDSWETRPVEAVGHDVRGSAKEPMQFRSEEIVERVEYNVDHAEGAFSTELPADIQASDVVDAYSPEGLKRLYEWRLAGAAHTVCSLTVPDAKPDALARLSAAFPRLEVLGPADQEEIRAKGREIGLDIP